MRAYYLAKRHVRCNHSGAEVLVHVTVNAWKAYEKEARQFIAALKSSNNGIPDEWLRGLRSWASANDVREFWLFGSRATGCSRPESDADIALALIPILTYGG